MFEEEFYNLPTPIVECGPYSKKILWLEKEGVFSDRPDIACTTFVTNLSDKMLKDAEHIYSMEDDPLYADSITDICHMIMILLAIKSGDMKSHTLSLSISTHWYGIFLVGTLMERLRREGKYEPESMDVPLDQMRNIKNRK